MAHLEIAGGLIDVALASVPGCESGRPPDRVQWLPGGRGCNDIRLLHTSEGRFVLRTRLDPLDRPGAAARQELTCHLAAARIGCAPPIIAAAEDGRWLLMPFVEAPAWSPADLQEISAVEVLGRRLGELHHLADAAGAAHFAPLALVEDHRRLILAGHSDTAAERVDVLAAQVRQAVQALAETPVRAALNHGDLQVGNMLGGPPVFIDWEYSQVADPTYDIACLLTYYPGLGARQDVLMGAAGLSQGSDRKRLVHQRQLFAALNRLWMLANDIEAG